MIPQVAEDTSPALLSVLAMVSFTVLAAMTYVALPLLVSASIDVLGFSEKQAGVFAAADMTGATLSGLAIAIRITRLQWRRVLSWAVILLALADWCSGVASTYYGVVACRLLAGLAEGALLAIANASIAETRNPDRIYALEMAGQLTFGAVSLYALPWLLHTLGLRFVFWCFAGLAAFGLLMIRWMPNGGRVQRSQDREHVSSRKGPTIGLVGVLTYFIAQGSVWSYVDRMGVERHIDTVSVARALSLSSLAGLSGALLASWLNIRFGRRGPLLACTGITIASLIVLNESSTLGTFAVAISLCSFTWNFAVPYQLGALAAADPARRAVALSSVVAFGGLALGPVIGAAVIDGTSFDNVAWMAIFFTVLSCLLFDLVSKHAAKSHTG